MWNCLYFYIGLLCPSFSQIGREIKRVCIQKLLIGLKLLHHTEKYKLTNHPILILGFKAVFSCCFFLQFFIDFLKELDRIVGINIDMKHLKIRHLFFYKAKIIFTLRCGQYFSFYLQNIYV